MEGTELFDLFGEEGFCPVCQTRLEDGERVRAVAKCQHLFHAKCLEPWLTTNNTCPLCRIEIFEEEHITIQDIGAHIQEIQAQIHELRRSRQRKFITWVVWAGVAKKLRLAATFEAQRTFLNRYLKDDPIQINGIPCIQNPVETRTQLVRDIAALKTELCNYVSEDVRETRIQTWPDIIHCKEQVQAFADDEADFQTIWS